MKKRFIFISILAIMTAACAESEWEPASQTDVSTSTHSVRQRTLDEALAYADEWFAQMDEPTRSEGRRVRNVEYVRSTTRTRAGDTDTLMYLVNYEDNRGFALLGRPATSKAIYAISEEGSLDMSDTVYNKPLAMFMASAREDAQISLPNSLTIPGTPPWDKLIHPRRLVRWVHPLLPENVSKWSQEAPYNRDCPDVDGKKGLVGCGPLAVGMLMAYYQFPKKLDTLNLDWENIVKYNLTPTISLILNTLASKKYLDSQYTSWEDRSTKAENIIIPFKFTGFGLGDIWNMTFFDYYNEEKKIDENHIDELMDFMEYGCAPAKAAPVILWGSSVKKSTEVKVLNHFWLTDGVIQYEEYEPDFPGFIPIKQDPAFHMVWGWGGKANGYYTYFRKKKVLGEIDPDESGLNGPVQFWQLLLFGKYIVFNK